MTTQTLPLDPADLSMDWPAEKPEPQPMDRWLDDGGPPAPQPEDDHGTE